MKIRDVMTPDAVAAHPGTTLMAAAEMMRLLNVGSLPVVDGERVVGILTDRDIVVRGLALGFNPRTASVADVMTRNVQTCSVDDDVEDVAHQMRELQVRRLLVVDERERLIGIVSLGDLAMEMEDQRLAGRVLEGISEPSTAMTH
ncbi:CBS domain-containing protein [Archangium violaceum]|uniref:CBS domain-containing protein n=1 Tax=Archangium violaceum TaxID=83451 RepID=UPI002B2F94BE|nr:CBS domain-containing protein [Archangium gephyra]WPB75674.1 CBS domain-containing protein [Archangium gephyra]